MSVITDAEAILGRSLVAGAMDLVVGDLNERLRVREMEETYRAAFGEMIPLPSFYLEAISVYIDGRPIATATGNTLRPGTFAIFGDDLRLSPHEPAGKIVTMQYYARILPYDEDRATRVQTAYQSLFLYGLLAHHTMLVRDDSGAVWQTKYDAALQSANVRGVRARQSGISPRPIPRYCA